MRIPPAFLLASLVSFSAFGQTYTISTLAGGGLPVNIPGTSASIGPVFGVTIDSAGNLFTTASNYNVVLRLDAATGVLTLVAGNGAAGFSGDNGPAGSAQLSDAQKLALDAAGNLYIADYGNNRIRQVSNGLITTVAGRNGTSGFSGDNGPATSAQLNGPGSVIVDSSGNLYIADSGNNRIRKVSNGTITTVAGNGTAGFSGDGGPATSAQLVFPQSVAVDSAGNLYIADYTNHRIRKVSNGVITTIAGNGTPGFSGDNGPATSAQLNLPRGVAVDSAGNLYIADTNNSRIRKVSNGLITTVAGNGTFSFGGDGGLATSAQLNGPNDVVLDSAGNLYIADTGNGRVRKVSSGVITTLAGGALPVGDTGTATITSAQLLEPESVAVDSKGNSYIADAGNHRIRKISNGVITTVAGNGTYGFSGDNGPATSAQLYFPGGIAVDSASNLYIADSDNQRVRKVSNGVIATVAGNGTPGFGGDNGPAASAQLNIPRGMVVDPMGNIYIADTGNNRIRMVSNGVITTVAGTGTPGFSGDNGPATSAQLNFPLSVALDSVGNLYIAEGNNHRIRKVSDGVITTVAGNGSFGFSGDYGPATSAQLTAFGVAVDSAGSIYIADVSNNRIRRVLNGVITTVAGNGTAGLGGDNGPATSAQLDSPQGVAVDSAGNIYFSDLGSNRIRLLQPAKPVVTAVANAASDVLGPIAPGEMVTIYGLGLGPDQLTSFSAPAAGLIATQVAGTQVFFDGTPAPIIYAWGPAVCVIVPYEITGGSTQVTVTYQGRTSSAIAVPVAGSAPGIFTWGLLSSAVGPALAVNQDGSLNSVDNPARIGTVITFYATGEGQTSPTGTDGGIASTPAPQPILPVTVTIGGQTVLPLYAGGAPGEPAGVMQINVQIPSIAQPGGAVLPITVQVGGASSQSGVTIAVAAN
jgi:trimeric autotransporter adhesin